jgi:hypothetical protein
MQSSPQHLRIFCHPGLPVEETPQGNIKLQRVTTSDPERDLGKTLSQPPNEVQRPRPKPAETPGITILGNATTALGRPP